MLHRIPLRFFDVLWWAVLSLFILLGVPMATFHGDETNHLYNSHDYTIAFIQGRPQDLVIDFSQPESGYYLRLSDSSVARYTIGLFWQLAGFHDADLPARGWDWTLYYDANVAEGLRPPAPLLNAARLPSTLFLCFSVGVLFIIASTFGGRLPAYVATAFYALNPVVLLNARRALQEGSLLFFGLLTIAVAVHMSRQISGGKRIRLKWWAGLVLAGGLTLASKNSGFLYVLSALGWVFAAGLLTAPRRKVIGLALQLAGCGLLMVSLLVIFSPGLWGDPITGLQRVWQIRLDQIHSQVLSVTPLSNIGEHIQAIITEPLIAPLQHFELSSWGSIPQISQEVQTYMASPFSGLQLGVIGGWLVILAALLGLLTLIVPRWTTLPRSLSAGLLLWLGLNMLILLVNPLPWQRYFIPLIPVISLLAGIGVTKIIRRTRA